MNGVLVINSTKRPLMPTSTRKARILLTKGKAAIFRRYPFTIILKDRGEGDVQPVRLKLDPGSKETGLVLVNEATKRVVFAMVLIHRGQQIRADLLSRKAIRRSRRNRNTRYRKSRFLNRTKKAGWLPPSLQHRIETVMTWVTKFQGFAPVTAISQELVRFDMQKMQNPEISGVEYQQGTLAGYEVREYLLEKWNRKCAYCGAEKVPLQVEHVNPKANGGTSRVSNLTLSCEPCNIRKGTLNIREFLANKPDVLKKILAQAKAPLKDAAAVNATRWALYERLKRTWFPVKVGSGGRTKYNRIKQGYQKAHWIDAACVGVSGENVIIPEQMTPLVVRACGHGTRQMCGTDKFGFPTRHRSNQKIHYGFQTGDMVRAVIPTGKYAGSFTGKITVRSRPCFALSLSKKRIDVHQRLLTAIHKSDGYEYE